LIVLALTSASLNIASYSAQDELYTLLLIEQIHGQIAFASLTLLVLFSISAFRTRFYELFYKLHVFLYLMIVINVGMHQPVLAVRVVPIISTIGSMWCLDRLYRTVRMLYSSWGNRVTLSAMPDGATKIVFERHIHCTPGSHAFVWIPSIRAFETHPFTISSPSQTQFLVRKQKGFTADLNQYALQHPNVQLRAFFDGPYGAVPNFRDLDKVILLAGGSGASFTCAIAIDLISQPTPMKTKAVEFVWTIKDKCLLIYLNMKSYDNY
jgi:predicted ferric reductase